MAKMFSLLLCIFTINDVFGGDTNEVNTLVEGDSLTLKADFTEMQKDGLIEWSVNGSLIVKINKGTGDVDYTADMFGNRLKVDQRGFLIMSNIRIKHSGLYEVESTSSDGTKSKTFDITVKGSPLQSVEDQVKSVAATEGNHVTLQTDIELQKHDLILWRFGAKGHLIAECDREVGHILYYGGPDERFRDRLQMDRNTGSLTIKNIRTEDGGEFKLKIISDTKTSFTSFSVAVSGSGLSSGAVVGIVVVLLLLSAVAAVLYLYCRHKNSELQKRLGNIYQTAAGGDVTINTETTLHPGDEIKWWFWYKWSPIAGIKDGKIFTSKPDGKFRDRLKLDKKTGSLTINNIRRKLTGNYTLEIISSSGENTKRTFTVLITDKKIAAHEGASETLKPDAKIQRDDEIQWLFGNKNDLIAKMTGITRNITYPDERFRDRLKLDKKTGSLTINNITIKHTGVFKLKIISSSRTNKMHIFKVYIPPELIKITKEEKVVLQSAAEIQKDDHLEWRFKAHESPIAEIKDGQKTFPCDGPDDRFKDTLDLDERTGTLTIRNGRPQYAGLYYLQIKNSSGAPIRQFKVVFNYPRESLVVDLTSEEHRLLYGDDPDVV